MLVPCTKRFHMSRCTCKIGEYISRFLQKQIGLSILRSKNSWIGIWKKKVCRLLLTFPENKQQFCTNQLAPIMYEEVEETFSRYLIFFDKILPFKIKVISPVLKYLLRKEDWFSVFGKIHFAAAFFSFSFRVFRNRGYYQTVSCHARFRIYGHTAASRRALKTTYLPAMMTRRPRCSSKLLIAAGGL